MRKFVILIALMVSGCVVPQYEQAQQEPQSDVSTAITSAADVATQAIFWHNH